MAERRVPRIRFKGFEEDWEQRKLLNVAELFGGNAWKSSEYRPDGKFLVVTIANVNGNVFIDDSIGNRININGVSPYILHKGDILVSLTGNVGRVSKATGKALILNQRVGKIVPSYNQVDTDFLFSILRSSSFENNMIEAGQGAAQKNIGNRDILEYQFRMPIVRSEQEVLGKLFCRIDSLLSLHQRKLEKLKILKKAMLEKMFPKNGARVPEIRFSGFTDDWEQRKLGELADIVGGGTPSTSNLQYWDGDIDWYAPAEINEQVYVSSSQKKITKAGYENSSAKLLPVGTVLFTSRAGVGKTAILAREACTNQGFQSIVPHKQELDSYFIFSRSAELKQYGEIVGAGSTFVEVSGKQMSEMELMMPLALNEQQAIGTYFRRLDQLLSLHQRKLEKLRQIKKSMLERIFV